MNKGNHNDFFGVVIFITTLFFLSCQSNEISDSEDVNQDKIFQNYFVTYNEINQKLSADVTFRFDGIKGNTLELSPPSNVTFDGEEMQSYRKFFGGRGYKITLNNSIKTPSKHQFIFTDFEGKKYINEIFISPIGKVKIPDIIDRNASLLIEWSNPLINDSDDLTITITEKRPIKDSENKTISDYKNFVEIISGNSKTTFNVTPSELAIFNNDTLFVELHKNDLIDLQQATDVGGNIHLTQRTETFTVIRK